MCVVCLFIRRSLPSTLSLAGVIARAKTEKPWKAIKVTKQCFYHGHRSRPNPVAKGGQKVMQKLKNANGHDKPTGKEKEHWTVRRNTTGNNELEKSTAAAAARIKTNRNLDKCYYGAQKNWTGWTVSGRRKKREKLREFLLLTWKKKGSNNQRFEWEGKHTREEWREKKRKPGRKCQDRRVAMANRNQNGKTLRLPTTFVFFIKHGLEKILEQRYRKCYGLSVLENSS